MTTNEANCFAIIKHWKRKDIWRRLKRCLRPALPGKSELRNSGILVRTLYAFFIIAFFPFIILWWLLRATFGLIVFPIEYLKTCVSLKKVRPPGQRNIQGIHNAFIKHYDLPIDLYLNCTDQWIRTLYPSLSNSNQPSIKQHIDPQVIHYRDEPKNHDLSFHEYAKSQVSRAREEISKELGFYR